MSKSDLINTIRSEQARLEAALASRSEAELSHRAAPDAWSIKDSLAHLTFWERFMLDNVQGAINEGRTPEWMDNDVEAATNDRIFRENGERSLTDILTDFRQVKQDLIDTIEAMPESALTDPERFPWLKGAPLWQYIADEAYGEHYEEHLGHHLG